LDGSLTGKGPNSWATPYYAHHRVKECEVNETYFGGVICDNTAQLRRVAFHNIVPDGLTRGQPMKVLPFDDELFANGTINKTQYVLNRTNYGRVSFKEKSDPMNGWPVPLITGHKYRVSWGDSGQDWDQM